MRISAVAIAVMTGVVLMANSSGAFAKEMHGGKDRHGGADKYVSKHMDGHHNKYENKHDGKFSIKLIEGKLALQGYKRIVFTDHHLPVYKAKACKHGNQFKLFVNKWGKVVKRNRLGGCHHG